MYSQRNSNLQVKLIDNAKRLLENVRKRDAENPLHSMDSISSSSLPKNTYIEKDLQRSNHDDFEVSPRQQSGSPVSHHSELSSMSNDSLEESITSLEFYLAQERNAQLEEENKELHQEMKQIDIKLSAIEFALGIVKSVSTDESSLSEGLSLSGRGKVESDSISSSSKRFNNVEGNVVNRSKDDGSRTPPSVAESSVSSSGSESVNGINGNPIEKEGIQTQETGAMTTQQQKESDEIKQLREKNELMIGAIKALAKATCSQARQRQHYKKKLLATQKSMKAELEKMSEKANEDSQAQTTFFETRTSFLKEQDKRETLSSELNRLVIALNFMKRKKEEDDITRRRILRTLESEDDSVQDKQDSSMEAKDEKIDALKAKLRIAIQYFKEEEGQKDDQGKNTLIASPEEMEDAEKNGFEIDAVPSNADSEISIVLSSSK